MRYSMALVALLLAFASVPRASDEAIRLLPFRLHGDGDIVVPVSIDGKGPFQFLLDTGSSRTTVSEDTARRLRLQIVAQTLMVTPSGRGARPLAPLARVAMGAGPPATVLAMIVGGNLLAGGRRIDGVIGQDILARRIYTIDYTRQHLVWHLASIEELPGTRLPLEFSGGRLLVSLQQMRQEATAWAPVMLQLIPDSGSDGFVFFARPGRALPRMTHLDSAELVALSGHRTGTAVRIDELAVGAIRLRNQAAVLVDLPEADTLLGDGLLPLHFFSRVTFNVPGGYLIVEGR